MPDGSGVVASPVGTGLAALKSFVNIPEFGRPDVLGFASSTECTSGGCTICRAVPSQSARAFRDVSVAVVNCDVQGDAPPGKPVGWPVAVSVYAGSVRSMQGFPSV